jgi:hypothetical protein
MAIANSGSDMTVYKPLVIAEAKRISETHPINDVIVYLESTVTVRELILGINSVIAASKAPDEELLKMRKYLLFLNSKHRKGK